MKPCGISQNALARYIDENCAVGTTHARTEGDPPGHEAPHTVRLKIASIRQTCVESYPEVERIADGRDAE